MLELRERFFARTLRTESGCLEWQGTVNVWGYGCSSMHGVKMTTHRIAWIIDNGPIPDGLFVLHRCDNRICVDSSHMFLGTQKQNVHDCMAKGRRASTKGEAHGQAKLNDEKVRHIRSSPRRAAELAQDLGVSVFTVYDVRARRAWPHVPDRPD